MNIFTYPQYTVGLTSCSVAATVWPQHPPLPVVTVTQSFQFH